MALEGTFDDMPLTDLIAIFRIGLKSGILDITGDRYHGAVYVSYGRLIDATVQEWPSQQEQSTGDAAVLELLTWRSASFVFSADLSVIRRPVTIFLDGEELIQRSYKRTASVATGVADTDLRHSMEYIESGNDSISADLGGYQHQRQIPAQQHMWRSPSEAASQRIAQPALLERTANQPVQSAPIAATPAAALNKAVRPAGRLLQAIIRRVRGL